MFTRLSRENAADSKITIDGVFVTSYMPFAPESYTKVYLYGLAAANGLVQAPTLTRLCALLGEDEQQVLEAYKYWEDSGLVCVHKAEETYVEYLPVIPPEKQLRKYSKEKYKGFNDQLHALMPDHNFLPAEYNEYYYCMESLHIEVEAMLVIIGYCKRVKGDNVHTGYILATARNFAADGCTSYALVSERIGEYDFMHNDLAALFKALKIKRSATPDDSAKLSKWLKTFGFDMSVVIFVAGRVKKGGMDMLDFLLTKYRDLHLSSKEAIEDYEAARKRQYELMNTIVHNLGLDFDNLDSVIETYLVKWQALGFTDETLKSVASYCLQSGNRTLESMNTVLSSFKLKGLMSASSIEDYINCGRRISSLLAEQGIVCDLDSNERSLFDKWTRQWKMSDELISLAASKAADKERPLPYMNSMLAVWFDKGVKTKEEAEALKPETKTAAPVKTYTAEELDAMFEELNEGKL